MTTDPDPIRTVSILVEMADKLQQHGLVEDVSALLGEFVTFARQHAVRAVLVLLLMQVASCPPSAERSEDPSDIFEEVMSLFSDNDRPVGIAGCRDNRADCQNAIDRQLHSLAPNLPPLPRVPGAHCQEPCP